MNNKVKNYKINVANKNKMKIIEIRLLLLIIIKMIIFDYIYLKKQISFKTLLF